jgi:hypothetical protein
MNKLATKLTLVFAAGCVGGLVSFLVLWLFFQAGVLNQIGTRLQPGTLPADLYQPMVLGGIWGFLFLFPILKSRPVFQALLYSLAPALVQLLVVFPQEGKDYLGLNLGTFTPIAVLFFSIVWAVTTVVWLRFAGAGASDKKK